MPCKSSYLEPSYDELESKKVCNLICFVYTLMERKIPKWVKNAAEETYGEPVRLVEAEQLLFDTLTGLSEKNFNKTVYNARIKESRHLADWFEKRIEKMEDQIRFAKENKEKTARAESLLAKYRGEEIKIIKNYLCGEKF